MKLLITSVGSLVGKNILDVLEFPGLSRRDLVHVVGTNSVANAPNNFRCDRCYLAPETQAADYQPRIREILLKESPDLILCGRDEDTLALSQLRAQHPGLPGVIPVGDPQSALIGLDKWETWKFTRRHDLPCAETFVPGTSGDGAALEAFCRKVGYPLVAKPVRGFASHGVHFLRNADDAQVMAQRDGYLLQEYLGDPHILERYFAILQGPPPLAARAQEAGHYSCQTVIAPNRGIAPIFVTFNPMDSGGSASITRISDLSLDTVATSFARALAAEGVLGPVNMGFRRDRRGNWKLLEINLRNTGATFARFLLGVDELYLLVRDFLPSVTFPELGLAENDSSDRVGRHQATYQVPDRVIGTLKGAGVWSRSLPEPPVE